jgi:hypothetical protein
MLFSPNPDTQPTAWPAAIPAANVDLLPGLEQPSVWKANLAFDTELPELPVVGRLVAGAEWLHTKVNNSDLLPHLNLGAPTRTGSRRPPAVLPRRGLQPGLLERHRHGHHRGACATPSGPVAHAVRSATAFNNVLLARKTSKGGGDAITLSVASPPTHAASAGAGLHPHHGHRGEPADLVDLGLQLEQPQHLQPQRGRGCRTPTT